MQIQTWFENVSASLERIANALEKSPVAPASTPPAAPAEAVTPTKQATKKAAPITPKASPAEAPVATPTPSPAGTVGAAPSKPVAVTIEEVRAAVTKLGAKKGRDFVIELLKKYGVSRVPELNPTHYAAVLSACNEHIAN